MNSRESKRPPPVTQRPPKQEAQPIVGERIETGGRRELPGEPFAGFTVEVNGDTAIKLHVEILPDERLGVRQ